MFTIILFIVTVILCVICKSFTIVRSNHKDKDNGFSNKKCHGTSDYYKSVRSSSELEIFDVYEKVTETSTEDSLQKKRRI